jgi:hypothetical protein
LSMLICCISMMIIELSLHLRNCKAFLFHRFLLSFVLLRETVERKMRNNYYENHISLQE